MTREDIIIDSIEEDLRLQKNAGLLAMSDLGNEWTEKMLTEPKRFMANDVEIRPDSIRNFRNMQIFVMDLPIGRQSVLNPLNILDGSRRGHAKSLKGFLKIIAEHNFEDILKNHPCSPVGNPNIFHHQKYAFTFMWIKHIYSLGLFKRYIKPELNESFTALDLGSSCGIFSGLLKREFKESRHILVDLPQQLSLAHYYLGLEFAPSCRIATYKDIAPLDRIDQDFIKRYDFILLPWYFYTKLLKGAIDVFTNFMSLQEMGRKYFDYYLGQEPFLSAGFFFTMNRYQSAPTYDNGTTILDFPLGDFTKLHFATMPMGTMRYRRKGIFFYTHFPYPSQHFEFIGKRRIQHVDMEAA